MRISKLVLALVIGVLVGRGVAAESFKILHVDDLSKMIDQKTPNLFVFDANGDKTRESEGVIPGAHLLSSLSYDPAKELPRAKDSKLVFYCANVQCMASHMAAERATGAGYTDVNVMADGIMGWKSAGKPAAKP